MLQELTQSTLEGNLSKIQIFLNSKIFDSQTALLVKPNNTTILHIAAHRGYLQIIQYLIENSKVEIDMQDEYGWTPLMFAIIGN